MPATTHSEPHINTVSANATAGLASDCLLMICRVLVHSHDGSSIEARAILDSAFSASFVSERIVQSLQLPLICQGAKILGVAGLAYSSPVQAVAKFVISPTQEQTREINVTVLI